MCKEKYRVQHVREGVSDSREVRNMSYSLVFGSSVPGSRMVQGCYGREREREILSVSLAAREGGHLSTSGEDCGDRRYLKFWCYDCLPHRSNVVLLQDLYVRPWP